MSNSSSNGPLFDQLSKRLGADPARLRQAAKGGSTEDLLRNLKPADAKRVRSVLENKAELERILRSDAAQALMKKLSEDA